jgi:hypothetical protein
MEPQPSLSSTAPYVVSVSQVAFNELCPPTKRSQATIGLTLVVSYAITSIRFYSRLRSDNGFHWNLSDTIIVTSLVGFSANLVKRRADERAQ